jgi:hypothetical protein
MQNAILAKNLILKQKLDIDSLVWATSLLGWRELPTQAMVPRVQPWSAMKGLGPVDFTSMIKVLEA